MELKVDILIFYNLDLTKSVPEKIYCYLSIHELLAYHSSFPSVWLWVIIFLLSTLQQERQPFTKISLWTRHYLSAPLPYVLVGRLLLHLTLVLSEGVVAPFPLRRHIWFFKAICLMSTRKMTAKSIRMILPPAQQPLWSLHSARSIARDATIFELCQEWYSKFLILL